MQIIYTKLSDFLANPEVSKYTSLSMENFTGFTISVISVIIIYCNNEWRQSQIKYTELSTVAMYSTKYCCKI